MTECVLLADKPAGPTSHDVVAAARRGLRVSKAGHAGTLDPFATGLLLLGLGRWTRLLEYLSGLDKEYEATARLGQATDTQDPEGRLVAEDERWTSLTNADVESAARGLVGSLRLPPPVFSAVKVGGTAAHRLVRRGEEVRLAPRPCTVHALDLLGVALPEVRFRVSCSSGTYVRSLAVELGARLGTACHLAALRRTSAGSFGVRGAASLDSLRRGKPPASARVPLADALAHLPRIRVGAEACAALARGRRIPAADCDAGAVVPDAGAAAAFSKTGELVAVCSVSEGILRPKKVFARA